MNVFIIHGNITKDPELKYLPGGDKALLKFTIAVNRGFKSEDGTDFFNCTLWGKRAESLASILAKGTSCNVIGSVRINKHDDKYYTEVMVNDIKITTKKGASTEAPEVFQEGFTGESDNVPW